MDGEIKPSGVAYTKSLSPLSRDHDYIRRNPAPAYWALAPHLIHQHTDASCSLATATMLLNGMRALDGAAQLGRFVSELGLLKRLDDAEWTKAVTPLEGAGLALEGLARKLEACFKAYEIEGWAVVACVVPVVDTATIAAFRAELGAMEREGDRLIAANYHLAATYGDAWDVGHFSPVGAYDSETDRVLLLDVWKADYEPCWIDLTRLLGGMTLISPNSNGPRGYIVAHRH